jgi:hypothetical protein
MMVVAPIAIHRAVTARRATVIVVVPTRAAACRRALVLASTAR